MIRGNLSAVWLTLCAVVYTAIGVVMFAVAFANSRFTEEGLIYDLIRLDVWALSFLFMLGAAWFSRVSASARSWIIVLATSVWGAVTVALFFHGTPYALNGYGGDQAFRLAMILKFQTFGMPGDFYYRGLPPFYPPVLYWLLGTLARVFSAPSYVMMKVGTELLYLLSPIALFLVWRRLVSPTRAAMIVLFNIVFLSFGKAAPLVAPHAFLANSLFIPWWFHYVEQIGAARPTRTHYLVGGIIGGLLFMTYYFPFFIGGFLLAVRCIFHRHQRLLAPSRERFRWPHALAVLGLAAVFSSVFWGPLLWSFITIGYHSAQQEWHHIESPGIGFEFVQFSLAGLAFLGALLVAVRRSRSDLYRGFLLFVGTTFAFHLIGSILGALDKPVNLIKAGEFIELTGGPLIGLVAALIFHRVRRTRPGTLVPAALVLAVLIAMLHEVNGYAKRPMVRTARTTGVPAFGLDPDEMRRRAGAVFLTHEEKLASFYPVYVFFAVNEHYSHPASRYERRLALLDLLQSVHDPYVFNLALRENQYDRVDYFMPGPKDSVYSLLAARSNYPNKHRHVSFTFDTLVTSDPSLFRREVGPRLFAVLAPASPPPPIDVDPDSANLFRHLSRHLTAAGAAELARYSGIAY